MSRSQHPLYGIWRGMIARCADPTMRGYGGRGIRVCGRWLESFEAFVADVGPRPSPGHSLDRYPNADGHYEPGNVRWATRSEQNRNRSPLLAKAWRQRRIARGTCAPKTRGAELLDAVLRTTTQAELASRLGVTQPTVSGWLCWRCLPSGRLIVALRRVCGIPETSWIEPPVGGDSAADLGIAGT